MPSGHHRCCGACSGAASAACAGQRAVAAGAAAADRWRLGGGGRGAAVGAAGPKLLLEAHRAVHLQMQGGRGFCFCRCGLTVYMASSRLEALLRQASCSSRAVAAPASSCRHTAAFGCTCCCSSAVNQICFARRPRPQWHGSGGAAERRGPRTALHQVRSAAVHHRRGDLPCRHAGKGMASCRAAC